MAKTKIISGKTIPAKPSKITSNNITKVLGGTGAKPASTTSTIGSNRTILK